ncbi:MAG TPA: M48 family metalloprotease [Candidatus Diapherotrites archaeon]|uniref:M48 family metalloprotease n=1 Tax=Candidatus Iainarchaeum sp. TaxID=3101447 RepID=A0A7J4JFJ4_9ARCH|nr:M48 family metalloprotease [Candidatus Diapherotrites archaeon]
MIVVTTGLLQKLNRTELEGVIAHEMSHIKNFDIRFMMYVAVMVGVIALLSDWILRSAFHRKSDRGGGRGTLLLLVIGIAFAVLDPLFATLIKLAISRQREFLADASGSLLTRYPEGLASALEKISGDKEPLEAANRATAHLYIVNPFKDVGGLAAGLLSTHPAIEERVKRLRSRLT